MRSSNRAAFSFYSMRGVQYDAIYVSPHLDDAVYSAGGQIALQREAGQRVLIVTVLGHGETPEQLPGVFRDYTQRKREDRAASDLLDVDHLWLNLPDLLARPKRVGELARFAVPFASAQVEPLSAQLEATLEALFARLLAPQGRLYGPLGIGGHPDHRLVFEALRAVFARVSYAHTFYEDVPYAQCRTARDDRLHFLGLPRRPEAVGPAIRELRGFLFAHSPSWQAPLLELIVGTHWWLMRGLFSLQPRADAWLRESDLYELPIDAVLERKLAAMRAYSSQTDYFFPAGDAIREVLLRSEGRYVERYWTPSQVGQRGQEPSAALLEQAHLRIDELVRQLDRGEPLRSPA